MNDERGGITTSSNRLRRPATHREFLKRSIAVAGAAAVPAFVPGRAWAWTAGSLPSRRIILGAMASVRGGVTSSAVSWPTPTCSSSPSAMYERTGSSRSRPRRTPSTATKTADVSRI